MTDYYVKNTGDDAKDGESNANAWKTIDKVNGETFSADDNIYFNRGDEWRESLEPPSTGSDGSPITFGAYGEGDAPIINGAVVVATWSDEGSDIWSASLDLAGTHNEVATLYQVFFVNTDDSITWGDRKGSSGACVAEYDWYYNSGTDTLYCYSEADPDGAYNSIEASIKYQCIRMGAFASPKEYITIENLHLKFAQGGVECIVVCDGLVVQDSTIHHIGRGQDEEGNGITFSGSNNQALDNTIHQIGRRGIYFAQSEAVSTQLVEGNTVYNCYHSHMDFHNTVEFTDDDYTIRYNYIYMDDDAAFDASEVNGMGIQNPKTDVKVYYNIIHVKGDNAIGISVASGVDDIEIYNNVIIGDSDHDNSLLSLTGDTTATIKNNILYGEPSAYLLSISDSSNKTVDYNCLYRTSGTYIAIVDSNYHLSYAAYQADEAGFDANGRNEDPLFTDAANADYTLQDSSLCIDAGVDVGLTEDYAGDTVPMSAGVDMGAYEDQEEYLQMQTKVGTTLKSLSGAGIKLT